MYQKISIILKDNKEAGDINNALSINNGIGNAVWKPWKKDHHEKAPHMKFNDMSQGDKKELKMELIDMQHFLFNMMLAVGMTPEELFNYYFSKNEENRRRQENNY